MKRYPLVFFIILIVLLLAVDLYAFRGLLLLFDDIPKFWSTIFPISYWFFSLFLYSAIFIGFFSHRSHHSPGYEKYISLIFGLVLLSFLPKLFFIIFFLFSDILQGIAGWTDSSQMGEILLNIALFLTIAGALLAIAVFLFVFYGITYGKHHYQVRALELPFLKLPQEFDGLRIVQISDIHIGSFHNNHKPVKRAVEKIMALKPDIIFFTGDLVNNVADELDGWLPVFQELHAPLGMYAVLGNHDYGDYHSWTSMDNKYKNLRRVIEFQEKAGFKVLLNSYELLKKGEGTIAVIGVENWGKPPFRQYGDLAKATSEIKEIPFKMLLSHDPSHWDAEVIKMTDIDLTLSGHTHGAQFGLIIGKRKWSPVKYKYPRWHGLYKVGRQYLYINMGFGYLAFYGRIGMRPEITLITLKKE